jgi:hypothetical protein
LAPKFITKSLILTTILALCAALTPASVHAAQVKQHVIKFYLDPALVSDMDFAAAVLPKYVEEMNTILSKNTSRRLVFDPQTDIIITSTKPQTDSASPPLPEDGFEIWAHATYTTATYSYGGYAGLDRSGAGVLAGLHWTRLYDPDDLSESELADYTIQIDHMLHEFAHIFGAGLGEYYSLAKVMDTTGTDPLLNINLNDPTDSFWSDKSDFMTDPLLRITRASSRTDYLNKVRYSNLTAAMLNGNYRNNIPSFDNFTIQVLDGNDLPVTDATVKVWNVNSNAPYASSLLSESQTDLTGQTSIAWGGSTNPHNSGNLLRLIKVYKDGVSIAKPRYVSIFDADIAKLVDGSSEYIVTLQPPPTLKETFQASSGYSGWVRETSKTSNKGGKLNNTASTFKLGDDASNRQYRAILNFDTSALPENAVITQVTLKIKRQRLVGSNPFLTHGNILVDIRNNHFSTSVSLQANDFQARANLNRIGIIGRTPRSGNWYVTDLKSSAFSSINPQGTTQLRLRFKKGDNNDNGADYLKFFNASANAAYRPVLVIEYHIP